MTLSEKIYSAASSFRLRKHFPLSFTMQILQDLYPTVDWSRVDFYEGLPWYTHFLAPYVTAQALPQFYSFSRYRIYIQKFDESEARCLADLVHEGMHILQSMEMADGYGIGILRGFSVYYGALFAKYGYRENPLEIPAYGQEDRFLAYCEKHMENGKLNFDLKSAKENLLVFTKSGFVYSGKKYALIISFMTCFLFAFIKPLLDIPMFLMWLIYGRKRI